MAFAHFMSGNLIQVPPVDEAVAFLEANTHLLDTIVGRRRALVGTPGFVQERLEQVAKEYGADEVMVVTITYHHTARRKSYELLAAEFGLG